MDTAVADLLIEGIWLMVIGLAIVFSFLLILVGMLALMSKAVLRWGPEDPLPESLPSVPLAAPVPAAGGDHRLIAVIAAAIRQHRSRHRP
jgi:oxaloacetate decarboxylase (Na+ extruding) subunit gamma